MREGFFLILMLFPLELDAAPGDYQRRQILLRSAKTWVVEEAVPAFRAGLGLEHINSLGVDVVEKKAALPPDLGGPRPGGLVWVETRVQFHGLRFDGRRRQSVRCWFRQQLLAETNREGKPALIQPGQRFESLVGCASSSFHPEHEPWR